MRVKLKMYGSAEAERLLREIGRTREELIRQVKKLAGETPWLETALAADEKGVHAELVLARGDLNMRALQDVIAENARLVSLVQRLDAVVSRMETAIDAIDDDDADGTEA